MPVMATRTVLVTGAAGCVGHYVLDALAADGSWRVKALVRDPEKLHARWREHPAVEVVVGDVEGLATRQAVLQGVEGAVLLAAAWGGPRTRDVNVTATHALLDALADAGCRRAVYFSTASVVDHALRPLDVAAAAGTDYIKTKHEAYVGLGRTKLADRVVTVFPTLIFGGDATHPRSHVTRGLPDVLRYVKLLRFLTADGSFQFIHARDLGRLAAHLLDAPDPPRALAAGNQAVTVRETVDAVCARLGVRVPFRLDVSPVIGGLLRLFGAQLSAWDAYCMRQRHLVYDDAWGPARLGLPDDLATLEGVLRDAGC